jgi:hypothetical protein
MLPMLVFVLTATYYRDWLQKLRRKLNKTLPDLLGDGPPILHDNARPHLGKVVTDLLGKYEWEVLIVGLRIFVVVIK